MYTQSDYAALLIHAQRAAELQRDAEQARLAKSLRRRPRPGRAATPWWQRQRRSGETRRVQPA